MVQKTDKYEIVHEMLSRMILRFTEQQSQSGQDDSNEGYSSGEKVPVKMFEVRK